MHALAPLPLRTVRPCLRLAVALAVGFTWVSAGAQPAEDKDQTGGTERTVTASPARPAEEEAAETKPPAAPALAESEATVAALFEDFLHYARLGRFQEARAFATSLLQRPDLDPVGLLVIADRDHKSLDTLITVINHSSIGAEAQRVLDVLREGESRRRQDPKRINGNITKLAGPPQAEYNAIENLIESGEYAVPWMVQALMDRSRQDLWPRILRALPQIGQPAVNPLAAALKAEDRDLRQNLIRLLGELGYPHAVPYLKQLLMAPELLKDTRTVVEEALTKIERRAGRRFLESTADQFIQLGEQYYEEQGSLRADPRRPTANVWYWHDGFIDAVIVPRELYGPIMAMRSAEEARRVEPARGEAIALWLAADIRREARLGLDVESGVVVENEADKTRPANFPRALYFSRAAGARYSLDVLDRAIRDKDTPVALGAIAALRAVAGETALVGLPGEGQQPLVRALQFPDTVVRIKAALVLAGACPKSQFVGSEWVMPVLAEALGQTGAQRFVVIDPDAANLNRITELLRADGAEVLGDADFYTAVERSRKDTRSVAGMFISCGLENPSVRRGVSELRREYRFQMTPIVLLRGPTDYETARDLAGQDLRIAHVTANAEGPELAEAMRNVMAQSGRRLPDPEQALGLALEAADVLLKVSLDGRTVLNVAAAEPAVLSVWGSAESEELRVRAAAVLALSRSAAAQRALAEVALDPNQSPTLRVAGFTALADSAKLNGNLLADLLLSRLVELSAEEPDLSLRTAASQALGALNLKDNKASQIIRKYYRG